MVFFSSYSDSGGSMLKSIFWDVQHGLAATIVTPNNRYIGIDLGTGSYGSNNRLFSPLQNLKYKWGVSRLDAVIFTHPHTDHLDDIHNFDMVAPQTIWRPVHLTEEDIRNGNAASDRPKIDKYLDLIRRYNEPVCTDNELGTSSNWGGVDIRTFCSCTCARSNLNNHSVVTVLSYAGMKILIPGDNEPPSWNELLGRPDFISAISQTDVFVAPHHGRDSGYSSELFRHITPKLIIVSDGQVCDTTVVSRYSQQATGWLVHKRGGGTAQRKCLTTRSDGVITVEFWLDNKTPNMGVTID
jgi:beta-lactamase superfamily II metal-dependent hydrolase